MPIFLEPPAGQRTNRAQRLRRRRLGVLLALIALVVLAAAAVSVANRPEPVQPPHEVPAAAAPVAPPGSPSPAPIVAASYELASAVTVLWILLIAGTVVLASLALRNRRARLNHGPLPRMGELWPANENVAETDVTAAHEDSTIGANVAPQPRASRRAADSRRGAPAASTVLTRAEAHALRRSAPLKPVAQRAPELEDRRPQARTETRPQRDQPQAG